MIIYVRQVNENSYYVLYCVMEVGDPDFFGVPTSISSADKVLMEQHANISFSIVTES